MATVVRAIPQPVLPRMAPREDLNPFRIAQIQFDMAAEYLKLDPGLRQIVVDDWCVSASPVTLLVLSRGCG